MEAKNETKSKLKSKRRDLKKIFNFFGEEKLNDIFYRIQEFGLEEKEFCTKEEKILLNLLFFEILKSGIDTKEAEIFIKNVYDGLIKEIEKQNKNQGKRNEKI